MLLLLFGVYPVLLLQREDIPDQIWDVKAMDEQRHPICVLMWLFMWFIYWLIVSSLSFAVKPGVTSYMQFKMINIPSY